MNILIATTHVPFVRGGAEIHAEELHRALTEAGHRAEIVRIPFKWYPAERILDQMLAARLLDLTEVNGDKVDLLIGLKFPAYLIPHPRKVLWILHQHRAAYDLWEHALGDLSRDPAGAQVRHAIMQADRNTMTNATRIFANSRNVASRLARFNQIAATPLYHPPPGAGDFYTGEAQDYLFFPSRLWHSKRQSLVLEALAETRERDIRIRFAGVADAPAYADELRALAVRLGVADQVEWLGHISEEEKRRQYANALAVIYPPVDEDYGYVTLEAMLAAKPVVTCTDSGGTLEFVEHRATGFIAEPTAHALAASLDHIYTHRDEAKMLGAAARARYDALGITWANVVNQLTFTV